LKEGMTGIWALLEAKQNAANPLVKAGADAFTNGDARTSARGHVQTVFEGSEVARLKERAVEELRAVALIVDTKAPEDADAFKAWLQGIAQKAAEAATEGGFMGFGGVAVSDREKATLAEISAALSMGQSDPAKS
jgi:hypothetical protein